MHSTHTIPLPHHAPLRLGQKALLMGILNVTPDSFSDGGQHNLVASALTHARQMIAAGADIIDVGGESTRPGATAVSTGEELSRVLPVIKALVAEGVPVPISIDTYKPAVAERALMAGANIINDVHGLQGDPAMAGIAAQFSTPVIAMHWQKGRSTDLPLLEALPRYFRQTLDVAEAAGLAPTQVLLDPGFGFDKTLSENFSILNALRSACSITGGVEPFAIVVGTSRKSMIGRLLQNLPSERLAGTISTTVLGYLKGGHIFRVHDIGANRDALRIAEATLYGPPA